MILLLLNNFDLGFLSIIERFTDMEEVNIVMIQDAVYLGLRNSDHTQLMKKALVKGTRLYALENDVKRRGIREHLMKEVGLIDYDLFIDLLFQENQRVINF